jgi:hypothetical protein
MEALFLRWASAFVRSLAILFVSQGLVQAGAGYRTPNFVVDAPSPELAEQIGKAAEKYRKDLAMEWLGKELPRWSKPCPIKARLDPGAGGATSFVFDRGEVFGWRMDIQGTPERILDSVLPHEITHTIFACHFRQPLPRWADEGACTTVEHVSEISKQEKMLIEFLQTRRGIPFSQMFRMKEYPQDVLPLYAQGHSLAHFLISQQGKHEFLNFISDGLTDGNWERAVAQKYGYHDLVVLQDSWLDWVKSGRPQLQLASSAAPGNATVKAVSTPTVVRGQDPASSAPSGEWKSAASGDVTPTPSEVAAAAPQQGTNIYEALSSGQVRR